MKTLTSGRVRLPTSRRLLSIAAGFAFAFGLAPAGHAAEVNFLGYNARFFDLFTEAVIKPFQKKTGIKVNYYPALYSAEELAILRAQKDSPAVDVSLMDTTVARSANAEGLFVKPDPKAIPNMANLYPEAYPNGDWGPGMTFDYFAIIYDTTRVEEPPKGLADLWKPEFKGEIAWTSAPAMDSMMSMIVLNKSLGGDYKESIEPALKKLAELSPSVQTWAPSPDTYTMVMNGTAKIGVGWNAFARYYAEVSKGRLGVVVPAEGTIFQINTINMVANGPHPREAEAFINYVLSPEAQEALSMVMAYAPTNKDAKVSGPALEMTAASPAIRGISVPLDWQFFTDHRDEWMKAWRREVLAAE